MERPVGVRYEPGMRVAVQIPSGELKELEPQVIRAILIGERLPVETPYTGFRLVVL